MALDTNEVTKQAADVASVAAVIGVLMDWLPKIAAVLTVLWLGVRFYNEIMIAVISHRNEIRNARRDAARDPPRDKDRDASRDLDRDGLRDVTRDAKQDRLRDAADD